MVLIGSAASQAQAQPTAPAASPSPAGQLANGSLDVKPLRAVILVDESGSLTQQDVVKEQQAAELLAVGELSTESQVAVVGFGSSDQPGQSPTDPVCPLTERSSAANQQFLLDCITKLHRRSDTEGNNTDHVAAINEALDILRQPDSRQRPPVIILLTDGVLDVGNSPQYGPDLSQRTANARAQLTDSTFPQAKAQQVPIWPLGFGSAQQADLDTFAAGGAQVACSDQPASRPTARIVTSTSDIIQSLVQIFALARCAQVTPFGSAQLNSGSTVDIPVTIPDISTDGSIVVLKGNPKVQVSYLDPDGTVVPRQGPLGDSTFEASAGNGGAESLHILNPKPGRWTVRLTAGSDVPSAQVAAAVVWQGVVQSLIVVDPPTPSAGKSVAVRVRVRNREGPITDTEALRQLTFRAALAGPDVPRVDIPLADDGKGADLKAGDGEYSGSVTIPSDASGTLVFTGNVDGPGIAPVSLQYSTQVAAGPPPLTANISLPTGRFRPGAIVTGSVQLVNNDGLPHNARLVLDELDSRTQATVGDPALIRTVSSGRASYPARIHLSPRTGIGTTSGRLRLVDADNPGVTYAQSFLTIRVGYPKPWAERYWWAWLVTGALLILLLVILIVRWNARRKARDLGGVVISMRRAKTGLSRRTGKPNQFVKASGSGADTLSFTITQAKNNPSLNGIVSPGAKAYVARRSPSGGLELTTPQGRTLRLPQDKWVPIEEGLELQYTESRPSGAAVRRRAKGGGTNDGERSGGSGQAGRWEDRRRSGWRAGTDRASTGTERSSTGGDRARQERRAAAAQRAAAARPGTDATAKTLDIHETTTRTPDGARAQRRDGRRGEARPSWLDAPGRAGSTSDAEPEPSATASGAAADRSAVAPPRDGEPGGYGRPGRGETAGTARSRPAGRPGRGEPDDNYGPASREDDGTVPRRYGGDPPGYGDVDPDI
ncbi:VWA domain-containing protein [Frankia sp. AgB1.9]|uniref:vWA domain-containing protein n=1 Tax=unclassified Frankia TaxID=2632575 RepID=UPI0019333582|nr:MULTISPECIES: vWA domain-containing protein [unclassified Frankia]MBL7492347.1 VWA domain-containing protein [Frankia sp. AgW1.1]MBL7546998.1 VWA domain-containing protein [Frankia sp. AgB1.9]MBL7622287.1 VWA domain-containing protein [Frankia sp. AgB1.8]